VPNLLVSPLAAPTGGVAVVLSPHPRGHLERGYRMPNETTDDVAQWLRALLKTKPCTARAVLAHLTVDAIGPPDIKQGLRRLLTALIEEATTHAIIADPDEVVQAFLTQHPSWRLRQGFTRFSAADPTWGGLYALSKPASRAFTSWIRAGGLTAPSGLK
jgi:hypothetical protein